MYPTAEEILAKKPEINEAIIEVTLSWKRQFLSGWKNHPIDYQILALEALIWELAITHSAITDQKPVQLNLKRSHQYAYNPKSKTIYLDEENPSIISTLHELAHHFYGSDELVVCRWSVWLFKECFPGLYKKLTWDGHLLVKKQKDA